jgi:hypothetical protein
MRLMTVAFGGLAAASLIGAIGLAAWSGASIPGLFLDAAPFTKLFDAVLAAAIGGLFFLRRAPARAGAQAAAPDLLRLAVWVLPMLGLLAALWGGYVILQAAQTTGVSNPRVIAPALADSLLPLGLGLLGGALADLLARRRARPAG